MNKRPAAGFTLVEMVVALTVLGVVATVISTILASPLTAYVASKDRAVLAQNAAGAITQITRDLRRALPNSVRMPTDGKKNCIEMLPTNGGGRYRAYPWRDGSEGNRVDFSTPIKEFDVLIGDVINAAAGDLVTIYNLGGGIPGADAYAGTGGVSNTAAIESISAGLVTLKDAKQFPNESPGQRFFTLPATSTVYLCLDAGTSSSTGNGMGFLYQYPNAIATTFATCPTTVPTGATAVAENVSTCVFDYTTGVTSRNGVATMQLGLTRNNETATLYREAHVNNVP